MPDEVDDEGQDELPEPARRHLRKTEKELREARAELEEARSAKRELLAMKAGIDLSTPVGALFAKGYDGEWEPDALKSAWATLGITSATSGGQDDGASDAAKAQRDAERRAAMEGQQHLGETKFGEIPPAVGSPESRLVNDLNEGRSRVTATNYVDALDQSKAVAREILHAHGMVLSDEVD